MSRFRIIAALGLLCAVCLMILAAALFLITQNPKNFAEMWASHALGHDVSFGNLSYVPGDTLHLELDDVHVANEPWGSAPDMGHIGHLSVDLDFWSFLKGDLKLSHLALDDVMLLLERNSDGEGNWKGSGIHLFTPSPETSAERSRSQMPTVLDFALHNSHIRFHTSSGAILKIDFKDLGLQTTADDQPVTLQVNGSYNDIPVHMDIKAQSFDALHNTSQPFGAEALIDGAATSVLINAQMMDPLNFDQVNSHLKVVVKKIGTMAGLFGSPFPWNVPLTFESTLERNGDVWNLGEAEGSVAGNIFNNSDFELTEGKRKQPDMIRTALNFENINVDALLPPKDKEQTEKTDQKLSFLDVGNNPAAFVDVLMSVKGLRYDALQVSNVRLHASTTTDAMTLHDLSMGIFGGKFHASMAARSVAKGSDLTAKAELANIDIKSVLQAFHIGNESFSGTMNAAMTATAIGRSVEELKQTGQGYIGLSMINGQVSRQMVRLASADVRTLFDRDTSYTPVTCVAAVVDFKKGIGTLSPFKMKTASGTLLGGGTLNMPLKTVDITFQTDPKSTSSLALDVPIHIIGKIDDPYIGPKISSSETTNLNKDLAQAQYPHWFLSMSPDNPCYGG